MMGPREVLERIDNSRLGAHTEAIRAGGRIRFRVAWFLHTVGCGPWAPMWLCRVTLVLGYMVHMRPATCAACQRRFFLSRFNNPPSSGVGGASTDGSRRGEWSAICGVCSKTLSEGTDPFIAAARARGGAA